MIAVPAGTITAALVMAPVGFVGPLRGYAVAAALVLALSAFSVAWLVRESTGRWSLGTLAAAALMGQPAVLQLWADGALEHMALWHLPAGIAALLRALRRDDARWAAAAGVGLSSIPIDGPYEVAYAAVLLPLLVGPSLVRALRAMGPRRLGVLGGWFLLAAAPLALASAALFVAADARQLPQLAADMPPHNGMSPAAWAQFVRHGGWEAGLPPAEGAVLAPLFALVALVVGLAGGRRALPWLAAALLSLVLSLGAWPHVADQLGEVLGGLGRAAGRGAAAVNGGLQEVFPFRFVRFPRRWTVVLAVALVGAAAHGVNRIAGVPRVGRGLARIPSPARSVVAWLAAALLAVVLVHGHGFRRSLPTLSLPQLESCAWIADQPEEGAVVLLPPSPLGSGGRQEAFAGLEPDLVHLGGFWIQLLHGRAQYFIPSTIPTLIPLRPLPGAAGEWVRAAEHRAQGREANAPEGGPDHLAWLGYRWIVVDEAAYGDEGLRALEEMLGPSAATRREFGDGSGVRVYEIGMPATGAGADAPSRQVATIRP